jgi:hypothetical protein
VAALAAAVCAITTLFFPETALAAAKKAGRLHSSAFLLNLSLF